MTLEPRNSAASLCPGAEDGCDLDINCSEQASQDEDGQSELVRFLGKCGPESRPNPEGRSERISVGPFLMCLSSCVLN